MNDKPVYKELTGVYTMTQAAQIKGVARHAIRNAANRGYLTEAVILLGTRRIRGIVSDRKFFLWESQKRSGRPNKKRPMAWRTILNLPSH